ncbi:MAG: hypothetical protein LC798_05595 [Chloroflexi bacterium]|nr:hypothetical protein [Chloroflexota bacterium]
MPDENDDIVSRPTRGTPIEPGDPVEEVAVTGRPADEPPDNSTFAARAKARRASEKRISGAENKAVQSATAKRRK